MFHSQRSENLQAPSLTKSHRRKKHSYKIHRKSNHPSEQRFKLNKLKYKHRKNPMKINIEQISNNLNGNQIHNTDIPFNTNHMVQDHLYISIVGLLCFFPTGIFGLIRAIQAHELKRASSLIYWPKLAAVYGRHALRWTVLSILIGTMIWTIFIIYRLLRQQHSVWDAYYQECGEHFLCSL